MATSCSALLRNAVIAVLALLLVALSPPSGSAHAPGRAPARTGSVAALVTLRLGPTVEVAGVARSADVHLARSLDAKTAARRALGVSDGDHDGYVVEVVDGAGAVTYRRPLAVDTTLRAEFADGTTAAGYTRISGRTVRVARPVVTVALPVAEGWSVRVVGSTAAARSLVSPTAVPLERAAVTDVVQVPLAGYPLDDPANRLDIVILGDGYTAGQADAFAADAKELADQLLSIPPYSTYAPALNVVGVFGPSAESGADHPPYVAGCTAYPGTCCPDDTAPVSGSFRATRYESTFCTSGIQRLLTAQLPSKVQADASAAYPAWDRILLLVNDPTYGGAGGSMAVASRDPASAEIMQHELGHSLLGLDDEYTDATPGYPGCSDYGRDGLAPCKPNVTDQTQRDQLKWNEWVAPSTPIPTSSPQPSSVVGLFLGAHYRPDTYYRSCDSCIMRYLGRPFGSVSAEQMPLRLYDGGWRGPANYGDGTIHLIEPGTATPDPSQPVAVPSSQVFRADVVGPTGGGLEARWLIDGNVALTQSLSGRATTEITFVRPDAAAHQVRLEVRDVAGILHPSRVDAYARSVDWQVPAAAGTDTELLADGDFELLPWVDWQPTNMPTSARKCGADLVYSGTCAARFSLSRHRSRSLRQDVGAFGAAGDTVTLSGALDAVDLQGSFSVKAVLTLADGSTRTVALPSPGRDASDRHGYVVETDGLVLDQPVTGARVVARSGRGTGAIWADDLRLVTTHVG